tara:strand:- start:1227 stop:1898 length:672 start_codon:yes stop_codon:yes gene_type:complete
MQARTFFITGTDTDAGKTYVSCALLQAANARGLSTAAVKPLAAGGIITPEGIRNDDALLLQESCSLSLSYQEINPLCLEQAIAPHIAARQAGISVLAQELADHCRFVMDKQADLTLIEGAGGWLVPLNDKEFVADIVRKLNIPVILVVGMRLGCLNHALLTVRALQQDGVILHGWIANQLDPQMSAYQENLDTLKALIAAPLLSVVPWNGADSSVDMNLSNFF